VPGNFQVSLTPRRPMLRGKNRSQQLAMSHVHRPGLGGPGVPRLRRNRLFSVPQAGVWSALLLLPTFGPSQHLFLCSP
jgi:hypothetical protein